MNDNLTRRSFVKRATLAILGAPLISRAVSASDVLADAGLKPLELNNPTAQALGYTHDASKVDTAKYPKRAGAEGAKQFCSNCVLYTQGGMKVDGMDGTWGKCTLFPQGLVNEKGWCNSWALKPGA